MAELTLFLDLLSQPCRYVYIYAKVNNIPFKYQEVRLLKGENHTEDYRKVNALCTVPALKDGDFTLAESIAILLYLTRKYKTPDHWYPSDLQKRAKVDEYLSWHPTNTRSRGGKVFWDKCMKPAILGHETPPEELEAMLSELNATLTQLEEKFLQDKPFIAGDEISLADLVAVVELMQVVASGENVFGDRPKLGAWKKRVEEAVGTELFREAHDFILSIKKGQAVPLPPELKERIKRKTLKPAYKESLKPAAKGFFGTGEGLQAVRLIAMSDLTLFLDLVSQPCRSVYIFAKVNNIPFKFQEVKLFKGEHFSEEFGKVNPLRKVPALKDGDFTLAESIAMLIYMSRKYKTPDHWYPSDVQKCARVDEYLAWQHSNTRPLGSKVYWIKKMTPIVLGHEPPPEKLEAGLSAFNAALTQLEEKFLQNKPFIAGDEISLADLVAIVEIMQVVASGVNVFEDRPKLGEWKKRIEEAVGAELFKEAHDAILNAGKGQNEPPPPEIMEKLKSRVLYFLNE
ncbi:glutathione S-transferase theta-2B [Rhinophrynus dorsalis]